jgi:hypothetical protein
MNTWRVANGWTYEPATYGLGHVWKTRKKKTIWELNQEKIKASNNKVTKGVYKI